MRRALDAAVWAALRAGVRRGLGGSRPWMAVGAAAVAVRLFQRMAGPGKAQTATEDLAPGQTIVITHLERAGAPRSRRR